jgi:hypothetical protein
LPAGELHFASRETAFRPPGSILPT